MHHYWIFMSCSSTSYRRALLFGNDFEDFSIRHLCIHIFIYLWPYNYILLQKMDVSILYPIVSIIVIAFIQSVARSIDRYVELLKAMWDDIEKWDAVTNNARTRLVARYRHISTEHSGFVGYTIPGGLNNSIDTMIICILISYISVIH